MKSYIRYGANGTIISGVLVKSKKKPTGSGWVEVSMTYCCPSATSTTSNSKQKAFIKYAGNTVIPGSTIVRDKKPTSGTWVEVPYKQCCAPSGLLTISLVTTDVDDAILGMGLYLIKSDNSLAGMVAPANEGTYSFAVPSDFTGTLQFGGSNDTGDDITIVVSKNSVEVTNETVVTATPFSYTYPIIESEVAEFTITVTGSTVV